MFCKFNTKGWGHYVIEIDLPKYNGERNPRVVQDWLCKLEQFFAVKLTPDWKRVPFASFHFTDYAHTWWRYVKICAAKRERESIRTWAQFIEAVLDFFMPFEYVDKARYALVALRRSHYRSLSNIFIHRHQDEDTRDLVAPDLRGETLELDGEKLDGEDLDESDAYFNFLNKVTKNYQSNIWDNVELPSYGGERNPEIFDTWIDRMETYLDALGIYGAQRIRCASMQLKGRAFTIWRYRESTADYSEREQVTSWREFKIHLLEKCLPNYTEQARNELSTLKHTRSIKKYTCKFWEISMRIPLLSDYEKVKRYIKGLKKEVQADLSYSRPQSLDDAIRLAFLSQCIHSKKVITPKVISRREMHFKKKNEKKQDRAPLSNLGANLSTSLPDFFQDLLPHLDFSYLTSDKKMQQYVQRMDNMAHDIETKPQFMKQDIRLASIHEDLEIDTN